MLWGHVRVAHHNDAAHDTIELMKEKGIKDQVKVIAGGAPISQDFAGEAGADSFALDAASAVDLCKGLWA